MVQPALPPYLSTLISSNDSPAEVLAQVVQATGEATGADRCFLYVRQPAAGRGRIAFCWRRTTDIPDVIQPTWQNDLQLPREDPLFAAALAGRPSVYVTDVQTAPPHVLNRDFENHTFGHRALVHAHLYAHGQLWGILQPCFFGEPHDWSAYDHTLLDRLLPQLLPVVQAYVATEAPS